MCISDCVCVCVYVCVCVCADSSSGMSKFETTPMNGTAPKQDSPSSFQEQLMSRIRLRSLSNEVPTASSSLARSQENIYSLPAFTTPPLPRASNSMSASASARTGPPPVSSKPARPPTVASKPSRAGYLQTGQLLTSKMCSCISLLHVHYCHVHVHGDT